MKRFIRLTSISVLLIITTLWALLPVQASSLTQTNCSVASMQGNYRFVTMATLVIGQGTVIAIPEAYLTASPAAFASEGTVSFDGKGTVRLEATADRQGKLTQPLVYTGTYASGANCVTTVTLNNDTSFTVKTIQSGAEQSVVSVTPGVVLTAGK